jgi:hypothetical protein
MGLKGRGDARANFAFIEGQPVPETLKRFPRIVTVTLGPPKLKDSQFLGRFVVPAPQVYSATPHFGVPRWLKQGVSSQDPTGGSRHTGHSRSPAGHDPATGFAERFSAATDEARMLATYLANHGYGTRKIRHFLPFRDVDAAELARQVLSELSQMPERPSPGSQVEREMVRYLHGDCGAPLERIAKLLDGNTWENLSRIQTYIN